MWLRAPLHVTVVTEVSQRMIHQWVIRMTQGNESQANWNKVEEICSKAIAEIKSTNQSAEIGFIQWEKRKRKVVSVVE